MSTTPISITTNCGRIVQGNPLKPRAKTNDQNQPVMNADGTQVFETYFALAIPKGTNETHWAQSPEGSQVYQKATADWPNGEHGNPQFSWKIEDGDSQIPNKNGKKNAEREGFPGHWIYKFTTRLNVGCFPANGPYTPAAQLKNPEAIKCGDYIRVGFETKGNASSQTPGMYLNPVCVELLGTGDAIMSDATPDAGAFFGSAPAPQLPPGVAPAPAAPVAPAPAAPVAPAPAAPVAPAPAAPVAPAPAAPVAPAPAAPGVQPSANFLNV